MENGTIHNLLTILLYSIMVMKTLGVSQNDVNMTASLKCQPSQNQCRNINIDKDRVVTLLDDGLQVMCDTKTDGGGWIIFQRRVNGIIDFYRGWEEYKFGFGDFDVGEFYLGNEHIYRLTSVAHYELRLEILFENTFYFAQYKHFRLLGENKKYMLKINGYSGNASDQLDNNLNMKFSTFDSDNDEKNGNNCAVDYRSAWWFKNCAWVDLNGNWGDKRHHMGINWGVITTLDNTATFAEMKMRRVK